MREFEPSRTFSGSHLFANSVRTALFQLQEQATRAPSHHLIVTSQQREHSHATVCSICIAQSRTISRKVALLTPIVHVLLAKVAVPFPFFCPYRPVAQRTYVRSTYTSFNLFCSTSCTFPDQAVLAFIVIGSRKLGQDLLAILPLVRNIASFRNKDSSPSRGLPFLTHFRRGRIRT